MKNYVYRMAWVAQSMCPLGYTVYICIYESIEIGMYNSSESNKKYVNHSECNLCIRVYSYCHTKIPPNA